MKKILLIMLIGLNIIIKSYAQTITPAQTTEQCPEVNITFTVTIAAQSITSVAGKALNVTPVVVQQPFNVSYSGSNITFSFVGKFIDNNNKQTFTVYYTDGNGLSTSWDASYTKIKSLLTGNSFSQVLPSPPTVTALRCQSQNFNISFTNAQFGNPWETPPIGYGTITNYEYQLPVNWVVSQFE